MFRAAIIVEVKWQVQKHAGRPLRAGLTRLPRRWGTTAICVRREKAEAALQSLREIMGKLKLTVSEEKTRICKVPEGKFDFLGYTFGRMFSARTGQARIGYRPSKKSIQRAVEKVHALTGRSGTWQETTTLVGKVNRTLRGGANYFSVGAVSKAYRALDACAAMRLRRCAQPLLRPLHLVVRETEFCGLRLAGDSRSPVTMAATRAFPD